MADDVRVIECSQCGRLHEVAPGEKPGTCDCGNALKDPHEAKASAKASADQSSDNGSSGDGAEGEGREKRGLFCRAIRSWQVMSAAAIVVIVGILAVVFMRSPEVSFAEISLNGSGGLSGDADRVNVEVYLRIIADNTRTKEHLAASGVLLQSKQTELLVTRLSELVLQPDLAARKLMIRMLGQLGDDRALPVLEKLFQDTDATIRQLAVSAVTQIDTPSAESILRKGFAQPDWAREMLPGVAMARNRTAARVLSACLRRPELCAAAVQEIKLCHVDFCIADLSAVAADRRESQEMRVMAIEALGTFEGREAHKALADLLDDSVVGWKARQVLDEKGRL
ncbi:MAG: HEAT repeat domain-containing protein [Planctomycetes bacterium]|nr:HEAT repeat domain-containing protein [Planctomycetota bacterium]